MSIYVKTKLSHFEECLASMQSQTLLPSEVVIIQDGHLDYDINKVVSHYDKLKCIIIVNKENLGLSKALNKGLQFCNYDIIFRMDADDICHKERFAIQLKKFVSNKKLVVLGTNVELIDNESNKIPNLRNVPMMDGEIRKIMHLKNPFNHPSVVYRKSAILSVGGYTDVYLYEDWYLWYKLSNLIDVEFENMHDKLLQYRIRTFHDRKGYKIIKAEFNFYLLLYKNKFIKWNVFFMNIVVKFFVRLLPKRFYYTFKQKFDKMDSV